MIFGELYMEKTIRLFDISSKTARFEALVLACEQQNDGRFSVMLDRTAFFPNEGGQSCDTGNIGGAHVISVDERDGIIYHTVDRVLGEGESVVCEIDFAPRMRKMQNHTAEHIISGIIHRLYGYENVGFHLGDGYMTADFNGELTSEDIRKVELLANEAVFDCRTVRAYYPDADALEILEYRSKQGIEGEVRIVEIDGVDACACCAPHVENTGEVGLIKILDYIRYKGGMRLNILAGYDALEDYKSRYEQIRRISMAISAKQSEVAEGVERLLEESGRLRGRISELKRNIMQYKLDTLENTEESICLFDDGDDMLSIRNFVNEAVKRTSRICAVFAGDDVSGYKYIMASETVDLKAILGEINERLSGKGGGSSQMIQGSCDAQRREIEELFADILK